MRRLLLSALCLVAGCDAAAEPAWLIAAVRSPDGRTIARAWCPDRCDVPGKTVLTLSPAGRDVSIVPAAVDGFPPTGTLPPDDIAATLYARPGTAGDGATLRWTAATALAFSLPCPSDGNLAAAGPGADFRGVRIDYRDNARAGACA